MRDRQQPPALLQIIMELNESMVSEGQWVEGDQLQHILTHHIGYGHAQDRLVRPLYLLLFSQGCETIVIGLLLPVLGTEWGLTAFQQSLLIMTVYLGVAIGSYLEVYSDRAGRHRFVLYNAAIQSLFGLLSCLCWNFPSFLMARFCYGVGIGICLPLSASFITEVTLASMRATLISRLNVYWSLGAFCTCIAGWLFLRDNSWRLLLFVLSLPGFYALLITWREGKESLRYLWVQGRKEEAFELANHMCKLNLQLPLSRQYFYGLLEAFQREKATKEGSQVPLESMFGQKYGASTVRLLVCWAVACFIYYGIMILLPSMLERVFTRSREDVSRKYLFLMAVTTFEVAGYYLARVAADHPRISRRRGLYLGLLSVSLSSLLAMLVQDSVAGLFVLMALMKMVISATFMILYPYSAEVYETLLRGKAMGLFSACGRVAIMLMGLVGISALGWLGGNGLYLLFLLLGSAAGYAAYTMPFCTGNRSIE